SLKDQALRLTDVIKQFRTGRDEGEGMAPLHLPPSITKPVQAPAPLAAPRPAPAPVKAAKPAGDHQEIREALATARPPATTAKSVEGDWESF
ncbi:chemotaxis protein, partial [Hydrogenophaga sp. XSHU_21]